MRKIMLALGSFLVGAMFMWLVGNHNSTFAQSPNKPVPLLKAEGAVPTVPPFRNVVLEGVGFGDDTILIDGILCRNCGFNNTVIEYGGGEFAIVEPHISGPVSVKLDGAALNTAVFLNYFGLLGCATNNPMPPINPAPLMKARYTPKGDFAIMSKK